MPGSVFKKNKFHLPQFGDGPYINGDKEVCKVPSYIYPESQEDLLNFEQSAKPNSLLDFSELTGNRSCILARLAIDHVASYLLLHKRIKLGTSREIYQSICLALKKNSKGNSAKVFHTVQKNIAALNQWMKRFVFKNNTVELVWRTPKMIDLPYGELTSGEDVQGLLFPFFESSDFCVSPALADKQAYAIGWVDLDALPFQCSEYREYYVKNLAMALQAHTEKRHVDKNRRFCVGSSLIISGQMSRDLLTWFHSNGTQSGQETLGQSCISNVEVIYSAMLKGKSFLFPLKISTNGMQLSLKNREVSQDYCDALIEAHDTSRVRFDVSTILLKARAQFISAEDGLRFETCFWDQCDQALMPYEHVCAPQYGDDESTISTRIIDVLDSGKQADLARVELRAADIKAALDHDENCSEVMFPLDYETLAQDIYREKDYYSSRYLLLSAVTPDFLDQLNVYGQLRFRCASLIFHGQENSSSCAKLYANMEVLNRHSQAPHVLTISPKLDCWRVGQKKLVVGYFFNLCLVCSQFDSLTSDQLLSLVDRIFQAVGFHEKLSDESTQAFRGRVKSGKTLLGMVFSFCHRVKKVISRCQDPKWLQPGPIDAQIKQVLSRLTNKSNKASNDMCYEVSPLVAELFLTDTENDLLMFNKDMFTAVVDALETKAQEYRKNISDIQHHMVDSSSDHTHRDSKRLDLPVSSVVEDSMDEILLLYQRLMKQPLFDQCHVSLEDIASFSVRSFSDGSASFDDFCHAVLSRLSKQSQSLCYYDIRWSKENVVKLIYVILPDGKVRISHEPLHVNDRLSHSELAHGHCVRAAGELVFVKKSDRWSLRLINNGSGHYRPTPSSSLTLAPEIIRQFKLDIGPDKQIDVHEVKVCNYTNNYAPIYAKEEEVTVKECQGAEKSRLQHEQTVDAMKVVQTSLWADGSSVDEEVEETVIGAKSLFGEPSSCLAQNMKGNR